MGPLSADRGNTDGGTANDDDGAASMGPLSADRGNAISLHGLSQRQRGFNGAAIS